MFESSASVYEVLDPISNPRSHVLTSLLHACMYRANALFERSVRMYTRDPHVPTRVHHLIAISVELR